MKFRNTILGRLLRNQAGATALEYGIIIVTIGLVIMLLLNTIGQTLVCYFTEAANHAVGCSTGGTGNGGTSDGGGGNSAS